MRLRRCSRVIIMFMSCRDIAKGRIAGFLSQIFTSKSPNLISEDFVDMKKNHKNMSGL